jgi:hypothetical protein
MIAYKLLRQRRDGSLGSLFIHRRARLPIGVWLMANAYPTKGYALRPGWHACAAPHAPHLSVKDRVWYRVELDGWRTYPVPRAQGGVWYVAQHMRLVEPVREGVQ